MRDKKSKGRVASIIQQPESEKNAPLSLSLLLTFHYYTIFGAGLTLSRLCGPVFIASSRLWAALFLVREADYEVALRRICERLSFFFFSAVKGNLVLATIVSGILRIPQTHIFIKHMPSENKIDDDSACDDSIVSLQTMKGKPCWRGLSSERERQPPMCFFGLRCWRIPRHVLLQTSCCSFLNNIISDRVIVLAVDASIWRWRFWTTRLRIVDRTRGADTRMPKAVQNQIPALQHLPFSEAELSSLFASSKQTKTVVRRLCSRTCRPWNCHKDPSLSTLSPHARSWMVKSFGLRRQATRFFIFPSHVCDRIEEKWMEMM